MATHKYFGGASVRDWRDVDFVAVVRVTGDEIVILNSDGTETRLFSANGDFVETLGGVTGSVSSMARTDEGGATVYETVSRVGVGVSDLLAGGGQLFDLVLGMAVTLNGHVDGGDPLDISGWSQFGLTSMGAGVMDEVAAQASVVAYLDGFPTLALASSATGFADATFADLGDAHSPVTVDLAQETASVAGREIALTGAMDDILGSAFDDHLIGDAGDNVIAGGQGDDLITLGAGDDMVLVGIGDGLDTITDFGVAGLDTIGLQGYAGISSFAQLVDEQRLLTVDGHAMVLLNGGDGLVLQNVTSHTLLTASQFQF